MKGLIGLVAILSLCACAEQKTLQQLEAEAVQSGDWSAVERREKRLAKLQARRDANCKPNQTLVCETLASGTRCYCVSKYDRIIDY